MMAQLPSGRRCPVTSWPFSGGSIRLHSCYCSSLMSLISCSVRQLETVVDRRSASVRDPLLGRGQGQDQVRALAKVGAAPDRAVAEAMVPSGAPVGCG